MHLVVRDTRDAVTGDRPPLPVRPNPELGMDLVFGDDLACQDVAHEEVVVHRVGDDSGDGGRIELDEGVMLGLAGL